jgi:glycerol kinase
LVAWSLTEPIQTKSTVFKVEFFHEYSVDSIQFLRITGLCEDVTKLSDIAYFAEHTDGVFFLPHTFGFVGVKQTTKSKHLVRAVLESIILKISHFFFLLIEEQNFKPKKIRIDGGIAQNDFICQQIANLTNTKIERAKNCSELTSIGCAMLQALKCGALSSIEDAKKYYKTDRIFEPEDPCRMKLLQHYRKYLSVVEKCK